MTATDTIEREKVELKRPTKWAVILHNDNVTPMDFVIELLCHVFGHSFENAADLMIKVHTKGKAAGGIYPHEVAEQKHADAEMFTRLAGLSFKLTLEEE